MKQLSLIKHKPVEPMPINLGKAAKDLRTRLRLSLREAEAELGISYVHLCKIENGKVDPSPGMIERFHDAWGIDLYMFAVVYHSEDRETPKPLQAPVKALMQGWKQHIEMLLDKRIKDETDSCLTSAG
ncbi:MAG TPA: helix-turn-helix transcriptional regulator [Pirellulales bacterium]|nr:helix-turn-helix transcriptional regulator [Pirellulales bacterium]